MEATVGAIDVLKTTASATATKKAKMTTAQLEATSKDFEAVFMSQMLKPMYDGLETDSMFGGGPGEDSMRDLLVQEYGKSMVRNDSYGLSPAIMKAMIQMQEQAGASANKGA